MAYVQTRHALGALTRQETEHELAAFVDELARRGVRIAKKSETWHQKAIDALLRLVTLGQQDRFLTDFVTTIGHTIYVPDHFETDPAWLKLAVLRHEAVHVGQWERLGGPLNTLAYLTFPLPMGLAWGRAMLERDGYLETLRTIARVDGLAAAKAQRAWFVQQFTGPSYGWMWPFPSQVGQWFDEEIAAIENGARS